MIPTRLKIRSAIVEKYKAGERHGKILLKFKDGHSSPLTLTMLYLFKVLETQGSVAGGSNGRFQAFCSLKEVNLAHELKSIRAQLQLIRTLMENSNLKRSKFKAPIVSNESLRHFAGKIRHVTTEYVTHAAKSLASRGVLGLGQLNAHHVIGMLPHLGTISIAH